MMNDSACATVTIFDLFGVVYSKGFEGAASRLEALLDRPARRILPVYEKWEVPFDQGEISEREFWHRICRDLGVKGEPELLTATILSEYRIRRDVLGLARHLQQWTRCVVYTNYRRQWFDRLPNKREIMDAFCEIFVSSDTGILKPNPLVWKFVAKKMSCTIPDLLLLDDEPANVESLRMEGGRAISFHSSFEAEPSIVDILGHQQTAYQERYSGCLLIAHNGAVILQRRERKPTISNPGLLSTFGGRAKIGESAQECASRELREETGLDSEEHFEKLGTLACEVEDGKWMRCEFFALSAVQPEQIQLCEGKACEVYWLEDVVGREDLTPVTRAALQAIADGRWSINV